MYAVLAWYTEPEDKVWDLPRIMEGRPDKLIVLKSTSKRAGELA